MLTGPSQKLRLCSASEGNISAVLTFGMQYKIEEIKIRNILPTAIILFNPTELREKNEFSITFRIAGVLDFVHHPEF
jgi:hypothetical protein